MVGFSIRWLWIGSLVVGVGVATAPAVYGAPAAKRPELGAVKQAVNDFFAAQEDHQPGDIISQEQVKSVLAEIAKLGWKPADAEEIVKKTPAESEPLVKVLRSKEGKKLMRKTANYSLVYDRLDRTAKLPGGVDLLETLPKLPDGAKYLQTKPTPGFKNLAQLLPKQANGKSPKGVDYDKPTGRIYTIKQLIAALEQSYSKK
jgi:hypothetical protein